jgi:hypothetical protein
MAEKTLLKTVAGIEIHVGDDGRFSAWIDHKEKVSKNLSDVEKAINDSVQMPLEVIEIQFWEHNDRIHIQKETIVAQIKSRSKYQPNELKTKSGRQFYSTTLFLPNAEVEMELKALSVEMEVNKRQYEERKATLRLRREDLMAKLTAVAAANFEELRVQAAQTTNATAEPTEKP